MTDVIVGQHPIWVVLEPRDDLLDPLKLATRTTLPRLLALAQIGEFPATTAIYMTEARAVREARLRVLAHRIAATVRQQQDLDPEAVVSITLCGADGLPIWQGGVE